LGGIGILFLLVAFGGHTPFYRLWYELMPTQKSVRAVGSAFYLVALPICAAGGLRRERLFGGQISARRIWIGAGNFAVIGMLGASGALGGLAQTLADPQLVQLAVQNAQAFSQAASVCRCSRWWAAGCYMPFGARASRERWPP
jgi:hypothetical protein